VKAKEWVGKKASRWEPLWARRELEWVHRCSHRLEVVWWLGKYAHSMEYQGHLYQAKLGSELRPWQEYHRTYYIEFINIYTNKK
jgi:hypothetical protein